MWTISILLVFYVISDGKVWNVQKKMVLQFAQIKFLSWLLEVLVRKVEKNKTIMSSEINNTEWYFLKKYTNISASENIQVRHLVEIFVYFCTFFYKKIFCKKISLKSSKTLGAEAT